MPTDAPQYNRIQLRMNRNTRTRKAGADFYEVPLWLGCRPSEGGTFYYFTPGMLL